MFDFWPKLGFKGNPYDHNRLTTGAEGSALLVGRDRELRQLQQKIGSGGAQPTIEGPAGTGKSSLIAVATYRMKLECLRQRQRTLFLPLHESFQLSEDPEKFEIELYRAVAQTLLREVQAFKQVGLPEPELEDISKWLNSPNYHSYGATGGPVGLNYGTEPNTSEGWSQNGFIMAVKDELKRLFPDTSYGAVICVIDNLELLETSTKAQQALENLRDRVFTQPGLRWVVCGSRGIVSRARSERLSGYLSPPDRLKPLGSEDAIALITRRIEYYGTEDAVVPVSPDTFEKLYEILNFNLRDSISYAYNYSAFLESQIAIGDEAITESSEGEHFFHWLAEEAERSFEDAASIQPWIWNVFDALCKNGGSGPAADYEYFGVTQQSNFSKASTQLANANLVTRERNPDDGSRSISKVTPVGWLVNWHRERNARK